jgi:hypothetical protein
VSEGPSGNSTGDRIVVDVLLYATARLLLVVALSGAIYGVARLTGVTLPLVVAVLFALIVAMPLGIWLFTPLRRRATAALAIAGERRRREREQLRARLRGEAPPEPDEPGEE